MASDVSQLIYPNWSQKCSKEGYEKVYHY